MSHSIPSPRPEDDPDYSATALESHWFSYPESPEEATQQLPEPEQTKRFEDSTRFLPSTAVPSPHPTDEVLRFGPGVPSRPRPSSAETPRRNQKRRPFRYGLAAAVLLAVLGFLGWQWWSPPIAVKGVTTSVEPARPDCDSTTDVVAVVTTNGARGTITYRWTRSDGTKSAVLEEKLAKGQTQARLHLSWSFSGKGTHAAEARLHITAPQKRTASAHFTYACR